MSLRSFHRRASNFLRLRTPQRTHQEEHQSADRNVIPILLAPWGRNGSTLLMSILSRAPEIFGAPNYAHERYQLLHFHRASEVLAGLSEGPRAPQERLMSRTNSVPPVIELPFLQGDPNALASSLLIGLWDGYVGHLRGAGLIAPHVRFYAEKGTVDLVAAFARERPVYCIFLKRDPRDIVASSKAFNESLGNKDFGWTANESAKSFVGRLISETSYCLDALDNLPPLATKIVLRYEDLVTRREQCLAQLSRQLGTPLPEASGANIPDSHRTSSSEASSIGRWRNDLPAAIKEEMERSAGPLMARLGYS